MSALLTRTLATVAVSLTASLLQAQPPGGQPPPNGFPPPPMGRPSPLMLLNQKVVLDALKLTRDQQQKIGELRTKEMQAFRPQPGLPPDKVFEKMQEATRETEKALTRILTAEQNKRLKEITLQQQGAVALVDPELAQEVGLAEEEQKKIRGVQESARKERDALFQKGAANLAAMRKSLEQIDKKTNDAILAVLSSEQKAKWEKMKGKPVKGLMTLPAFPPQPPR